MRRYDQLDSIRGIAAVIVFLNHIFLSIPVFAGDVRTNDIIVRLLAGYPLGIIWAGDQAVLIFFILSGFVLSLSFYDKKVDYTGYYIKRFFRLYVPYIIIIGISIIMNLMFFDGNIECGSNWVNHQWTNKITLKQIVDHILAVGNFETHAFNPPIWSLVHEMRISIFFPLLILLIKKIRWLALFITPFLTYFGYYLTLRTGSGNLNYFMSMYYMTFFIFGAVSAMYRQQIASVYLKIPYLYRILILICGILLLAYPQAKILINPFYNKMINHWIVSIGALLIISIAISSSGVRKFLTAKPLLYIGKISYSFYLSHFVVILSLLYQLGEKMSFWLIGILSFMITLVISTVLYYTVEKPSMALGKKFSRKLAMKLNRDEAVEMNNISG